MSDDLIRRQAAIDALAIGEELLKRALDQMYVVGNEREKYEFGLGLIESYIADMKDLPSAQSEQQWIPVKTRPMTEEERRYYAESLGWDITDDEAVMFDCKMPEDGQEIWVCSKCGNVWVDKCEVDEGIGLEENGDWLDIVAWMPFKKPEPWKGEDDE